MTDLIIAKKNETYITLTGEPHIIQEISDIYTFYAEGYRYQKLYQSRRWDGKVRLLKRISERKGNIYHGLLDQIIDYCKSNGYSLNLQDFPSKNNLNEKDLLTFLESLQVTSNNQRIELRDYQIKGFIDSITNKRNVNLSCTGSGKSLIIYCIIRYLIQQNLKCLIIVPTVSLVHQLTSDFDDYSTINQWNAFDNVHKIFSGQDKLTNKLITISTYQSLNTIKKDSYFEQFDVVIGDECHQAKATSLINIISKCTNASYRLGFTGTLDNIKANQKTIIGLFGSTNQLNTTKQLMDKGEVANFRIRCLILKHDKESSKAIRKFQYKDEIKYLITHKKRNTFIKNLAIKLEQNTIILVNYIEHGKMLYEMIKNSKYIGNRNVYYIYGAVEGEERERIRKIVETEKDAIIIGSTSIMSQGINIKSLHNIIFAIGSKSRIRVLQSIGRALRLHENKECAVLYDIVDDLSHGKRKNFSLLHFMERVKLYNSEQFDFKLKYIDFS